MLKATAQGESSSRRVFAATLAVALALTASVFLALWPCSFRTTRVTGVAITSSEAPGSAAVERSSCRALPAQNGSTLVVVGAPVILALAGLGTAVIGRSAPQLVLGGALLTSMLLSSLLMFFAPAGAALVASGAVRR